MTDTSAGIGTTPKAPQFNLSTFFTGVLTGQVLMGAGVVGLVVLLIIPLPAFLLDFLLAISVTSSVLILMTALFIRKPLEFSAFPAVLLVATMFRLGLNIASTRLILSHGHEGPDAAGEIIAAFGDFIMGGNFVIGIIVFIILVIVNFVVITKGSTRIAEVAARFSLDAMPGKQMAVDADLSAGLISEDEARRRRKELEGESNFFGAMDGASKFVRGDAVAGLIITAINLVGGIAIGIGRHGMGFGEAVTTFSMLTVGDGLVTQIPALLVSVAAGIVVTKGSTEGTADQALMEQLASSPKPLAIAAGASGLMAVMPGMPFLPFIALAGAAGYGAWRLTQKEQQRAIAASKPPLPTP
jgi:flagellar biosynthesis protein FlhA